MSGSDKNNDMMENLGDTLDKTDKTLDEMDRSLDSVIDDISSVQNALRERLNPKKILMTFVFQALSNAVFIFGGIWMATYIWGAMPLLWWIGGAFYVVMIIVSVRVYLKTKKLYEEMEEV